MSLNYGVTKNDQVDPKSRTEMLRYLAKRDAGWICTYCLRDLAPRYGGGVAPTIDHFIPRVMGGTDDADNLVLSCSPCNLRKGNALWPPARPVAVSTLGNTSAF